jgi:hypothetical protein
VAALHIAPPATPPTLEATLFNRMGSTRAIPALQPPVLSINSLCIGVDTVLSLCLLCQHLYLHSVSVKPTTPVNRPSTGALVAVESFCVEGADASGALVAVDSPPEQEVCVLRCVTVSVVSQHKLVW